MFLRAFMCAGALALSFGTALADPDISSSWRETKNRADDQIYFDHRVTLYCGCDYVSDEDNDGSGKVDLGSCDYAGPKSQRHRAGRVEWEHIVPASLMPARQFECWMNGSRDECERDDPRAQAMLFDLHNLAPSIGQVNALRLNDRYGEIDGEAREFGACEIEDGKGIFEPADDTRGDVARVWFYMIKVHGVEISNAELEMFVRWDAADPISDWERLRDDRIFAVQGNRNPFIAER